MGCPKQTQRSRSHGELQRLSRRRPGARDAVASLTTRRTSPKQQQKQQRHCRRSTPRAPRRFQPTASARTAPNRATAPGNLPGQWRQASKETVKQSTDPARTHQKYYAGLLGHPHRSPCRPQELKTFAHQSRCELEGGAAEKGTSDPPSQLASQSPAHLQRELEVAVELARHGALTDPRAAHLSMPSACFRQSDGRLTLLYTTPLESFEQ